MKFTTRLSTLISLLAIVGTTNAHGHSSLTSSNPSNAAIVSKLPSTVTLSFNEDLLVLKDKQPNSISLSRDSGTLIRTGDVQVMKNKLRVSIRPASQFHGRVKVTYRVVSADGHPVMGTFTFTVK